MRNHVAVGLAGAPDSKVFGGLQLNPIASVGPTVPQRSASSVGADVVGNEGARDGVLGHVDAVIPVGGDHVALNRRFFRAIKHHTALIVGAGIRLVWRKADSIAQNLGSRGVVDEDAVPSIAGDHVVFDDVIQCSLPCAGVIPDVDPIVIRVHIAVQGEADPVIANIIVIDVGARCIEVDPGARGTCARDREPANFVVRGSNVQDVEVAVGAQFHVRHAVAVRVPVDGRVISGKLEL